MSSLQCPTTLLLVAAGADGLADRVAGRRVARVWATGPAARDTAYALAEGVGVGVSEPAASGLGGDERQRLRGVLEEVADAHPGETVLVVADRDALRHSLPGLVQMRVAPAAVGVSTVIEVAADADGWVCLAWADEG